MQDISSNADRQAICRALIALARELKLEVLAEGTETLFQADAASLKVANQA